MTHGVRRGRKKESSEMPHVNCVDRVWMLLFTWCSSCSKRAPHLIIDRSSGCISSLPACISLCLSLSILSLSLYFLFSFLFATCTAPSLPRLSFSLFPFLPSSILSVEISSMLVVTKIIYSLVYA